MSEYKPQPKRLSQFRERERDGASELSNWINLSQSVSHSASQSVVGIKLVEPPIGGWFVSALKAIEQ